MRNWQNIIGILALLLTVACTQSPKEENNSEITAKKTTLDWKDEAVKNKIVKAIDKHMVEGSYKEGRTTAIFEDRISNILRYYQIGGVQRDSMYPLSEDRIFVKVVTTSDPAKDYLEFDYEVKVQPAKDNADSLVFEVAGRSLRKINDQERYTLRKEGNFWIKELKAIQQ